MTERLSLREDGVEMVDYPETTKHNVRIAANEWVEFLRLPQSSKESFAAQQLQSGVGYERKGGGERESNDIKENFDITARSLPELLRKAGDSNEARAFIEAASTLFNSTAQMTADFGRHVEDAYDITGFADEAKASASSAFIRFLSYPSASEGTVIGEAHVDHSGFTFHLYESTDGCDRLSYDKNTWLPMPVENGKTAVFASMQTQLFSHGELNGLCHKVTANHKTSQIGRIAIVCFVPLINTPTYDRKSHGRLQEMKPGFNYNMPTNDFSQLFC